MQLNIDPSGTGNLSRREFIFSFASLFAARPVFASLEKNEGSGPWFKLHEDEHAIHTPTGRIARCYRGHIYLTKTHEQKPACEGECDICAVPNCRELSNELGGEWKKVEPNRPSFPEAWKYSN